MEGHGPKGWIYLSSTRCLYPECEVDAYIRGLAARRPAFNLFRPSPTRLSGVA
jgi:hypothetical protein